MKLLFMVLLAFAAEFDIARRRAVPTVPAWSETDGARFDDLEWARALRRIADRRAGGASLVVYA